MTNDSTIAKIANSKVAGTYSAKSVNRPMALLDNQKAVQHIPDVGEELDGKWLVQSVFAERSHRGGILDRLLAEVGRSRIARNQLG